MAAALNACGISSTANNQDLVQGSILVQVATGSDDRRLFLECSRKRDSLAAALGVQSGIIGPHSQRIDNGAILVHNDGSREGEIMLMMYRLAEVLRALGESIILQHGLGTLDADKATFDATTGQCLDMVNDSVARYNDVGSLMANCYVVLSFAKANAPPAATIASDKDRAAVIPRLLHGLLYTLKCLSALATQSEKVDALRDEAVGLVEQIKASTSFSGEDGQNLCPLVGIEGSRKLFVRKTGLSSEHQATIAEFPDFCRLSRTTKG